MSENKAIRSYGRMRGRKMRAAKQSLIEVFLPQIRMDVGMLRGGDAKSIHTKLFPHISASSHPDIFLEIGFGGGEHLAVQAEANPEVGFIGCEPFVNGVGELLKHVQARDLSNVRIFPGDVRELLPHLPELSLERVYILFPDPWPKSRHHKRRLIRQEFLTMLARAMKPGAELRLATDWPDYASWMLEQILAHPQFEWRAKKPEDWQTQPLDWVETRYQKKAQREGRASLYIQATTIH